jgi:hypothetical protein
MDYPGYLGYWHRGRYVLAIHADWPAYPGQGTGDVLYDLCQFPHGNLRTAFKFIRNEFAHRVDDVPRDRVLPLLVRLASLIEAVQESR